jgi:hypothetical protein
MINNNRIVPVMETDLISLYSVILSAAQVTFVKLAASGIGDFAITDGTTAMLADEPVKKISVAEGVTAFTLYFVPDPEFAGFGDATVSGDVNADGKSLYKAVLSSSTITITQVGL